MGNHRDLPEKYPPSKVRYDAGARNINLEMDSSSDGNQIRKFLDEAKNRRRLIVDYANLIKSIMPGAENCPEPKGCFFMKNGENRWKNDSEYESYFNVTGPFVIRLEFSGSKKPSGVSINGRLPEDSNMWWKGISNIFFGVGDGGKRLYIDAKNNWPAPFILYDKTLDKKVDGIYVLFNEKGSSLLVTDLKYNKIVFLDLNKTTKNRFPDGLFPDKKFYVGYAIAPSSDLAISSFSIL